MTGRFEYLKSRDSGGLKNVNFYHLFSILCPLKLLSIVIGATLKDMNMLLMWCIFFPLLIVHIRRKPFSTLPKRF